MSGVTLNGFIHSYQVASLPVVVALLLWSLGPRLKKSVQNYLRCRELYRKYLRPSVFDFDVLVIGAGAAGICAAETAISMKAKVGLIEKNRGGGTNLYFGSVPSKTLIRSARVAQMFRRGYEFGLQDVEPSVDYARLSKRILEVIHKVEPKSNLELLAQLGVENIEGSAKILDPYRVEIGGKIFSTRFIVIATGSQPVLPEQAGFKDVPHYTMESFWQLDELPKRVLILGAGTVGCELAQSLNRLGCDVTLSERREMLLQKIDHDVSAVVLRQLEREGCTVALKSEITHFEKGANGCKAHVVGGGQIAFDALILTLGRRAVTNGLGLEDLGIILRRDGTIECDEYLRTKFPNIFVCGDAAGPFQLVHASTHQARVAIRNALYSPFRSFKADYTALPQIAYTEPEVARVGWNETEAFAAGLDYDVHKFFYKDLDRAVCDNETEGFVKILCEKNGGRLLGTLIVGAQAGELIGEFVLALRKKMNLHEILETVHAYPSYLGANRAAVDVALRSRKMGLRMKALEHFNRWRRGG
jgi:pyruvate/2-oxoglutarate dehydrogenase complex dihydrolipoamide dehydrogenase (E3) component